MIKAYAAKASHSKLEAFEYNAGPLKDDEVEIKVLSCGICHSDLSMLHNEWGQTAYPIVPGHEVVGEISVLGKNVTHLKVGQKVGLGWYSRSCLHCSTCMSGDQNLCAQNEQTIVGRNGGFADKVRCQADWAIPLPDSIDLDSAGPLFCGGITVFNPIVQLNIQPTHRVGVIGIGGLGHLAIQFLNKWGCEVTAFSSNPNKKSEVMELGAHHLVTSNNSAELEKQAGRFDFILCTANVPLDWNAYLNALRPKGKLHMVGAVLEPLPVPAFSLIGGQRSVSGTPLGSPGTTQKMLEFCVRHKIQPVIQKFKMSEVNKAIEHLESGKARYRVVLENDF